MGLGLILIAACRSPQQATEIPQIVVAEHVVVTSTSARAELAHSAERAWSDREDKAALSRAIGIWERIATETSSNADTLVLLSRAYFFLGEAHLALEDEREDEELAAYEQGAHFAELGLRLYARFRTATATGADVPAAIAQIGASAVPCAFWYAANLARMAANGGLTMALANKERVLAASSRVLELEPTYFYSGADRLLGGYFATLPTVIGKDLVRARAHFERSEANAPFYLPTRVVEAQFLAVELQDRALYRRLLESVLSAGEGDELDVVPENRAAKRRAIKMLSEMDEKFWMRASIETGPEGKKQ